MRRTSILYAAPGSALVPTAGTTRNILAVARELSALADVTVAFAQLPDRVEPSPFPIRAIDRTPLPQSSSADGVAARGLDPLRHWANLARLRAFGREAARDFDIVLEKGWRLSGFLCREVQSAGTAAVLVENDSRHWAEPIRQPRDLARYTLHLLAQTVAGACSRRADRVICESEELAAAVASRRGVDPRRTDVVSLGVDHDCFQPEPQLEARRRHSIPADRTVLVYTGGIDFYHDLEPMLRGLAQSRANVEVHIAGNGPARAECEGLAEDAGLPVRFHGALAAERIPGLIACADLCLAPYRASAFHDHRVQFATLKIPEYMACARPVASVPSGPIARLVEDGETGFLLANEADRWAALLTTLPPRDRLAAMGERARHRVAYVSWSTTAARYAEICGDVLAERRASCANRPGPRKR